MQKKKCQVLRIGKVVKSTVIYLKNRTFQWSSTEANALWMSFTTKKENIFQLNLKPKIRDFRKCLQLWQHRNLTLMGKITVLKSFALPKLKHALSSLQYPSKEIIKEIEKIRYAFIWEGKPEEIKREILILDYEKGGLKMIDLEMFIMSLKISWLKRISVSENNRTINYIYSEKLIFDCNFSPDDVNSIIQKNIFINESLTTWYKCNIKKRILNYRNEIMWNNYDIKAGGKTIFYANWYQNGI